MKQVCIKAVSTALGRTIDAREAQAIEARLLANLRADAKDRALWGARTPAERVLAAGERAAMDAVSAARAARAALAPGAAARRFEQAPVRPAPSASSLRFGQETEVAALLARIDAGAPREEILSSPIFARVEAHSAGSTPTATIDQAMAPDFLEGRGFIDPASKETLDGAEAVSRLRAHYEAAAGGPVARERRAVIVMGHPGAGKSTFIKNLARGLGAAVADADVAKAFIPAYEDGYNTQAVHFESARLRKEALDPLIDDGANVVVERVGDQAGALQAELERFGELGYEISLVHIKVDADEAVRRMARRFIAAGRFIDPAYYRRIAGQPGPAFELAIAEKGWNGYVEIDANGPQGTEFVARAGGPGGDALGALSVGAHVSAGQPAGRGASIGGGRTGDPAGAGGAAEPENGNAGASPGASQDPLGQAGPDGVDAAPRGEIEFNDAGAIIRLFEGADASTPFHEFGHFFLELMGDAAAREGAPAQLAGDWAAVLDFVDAKDRAAIDTAGHEKFARAFEAYLREGRAPSPGLKGAFEAFKAWLTAIYRSVRELDVTLSDEMRGVFDRLVKDSDDAPHNRSGQPAAATAPNARAAGAAPPRPGRRGEPAGRSEPGGAPATPDLDAQKAGAPQTIAPRLLARDPDLKTIADELAAARDDVERLAAQGLIDADDAREALADLESLEKQAAKPEALRAAAFCLQHGARPGRVSL